MSTTSLLIVEIFFAVIIVISIIITESRKTKKRQSLKRLADGQKFPYPSQDLSDYSYFNSDFNLLKISSGLNPVITDLLQPIWNKIILQHLDEDAIYKVDTTHLPKRLDDALISICKEWKSLYGLDEFYHPILNGVIFNNAIFAINYELFFTDRELILRLRKNNCTFNIYVNEDTTSPTRTFNFDFDNSDYSLSFYHETYKPSGGASFIYKLSVCYKNTVCKIICTDRAKNREDVKGDAFAKKIYEYISFFTEGL